MSQLHRAGPPSAGKPPISITWPDFVQLVLELTIRAYRVMCLDRIAKQDWEENTFTINLGEVYLRPIAFNRELPIFVHVRPKTHTEKMKAGKQKTIEAKEIDMKLHGGWEINYHTTHFVWEAKRVGDKRTDQKYSILNSEYINEAIYRFIRCEYANGLEDAGVLGYVFAGDVGNIVGDINQSMGNIRKNPRLPTSNHLHKTPPIKDFEDVYASQHTRTDKTQIQLHHLFLTFEFI